MQQRSVLPQSVTPHSAPPRQSVQRQSVHTPQGGTHIDGLKSAVTRVLNARADGRREARVQRLHQRLVSRGRARLPRSGLGGVALCC